MPALVDGRGVKVRACSIAKRRERGLDAVTVGQIIDDQGSGRREVTFWTSHPSRRCWARRGRERSDRPQPGRGGGRGGLAGGRRTLPPPPPPRRRSRRLDGVQAILTTHGSRQAGQDKRVKASAQSDAAVNAERRTVSTLVEPSRPLASRVALTRLFDDGVRDSTCRGVWFGHRRRVRRRPVQRGQRTSRDRGDDSLIATRSAALR
jgi:hypothetical protein